MYYSCDNVRSDFDALMDHVFDTFKQTLPTKYGICVIHGPFAKINGAIFYFGSDRQIVRYDLYGWGDYYKRTFEESVELCPVNALDEYMELDSFEEHRFGADVIDVLDKMEFIRKTMLNTTTFIDHLAKRFVTLYDPNNKVFSLWYDPYRKMHAIRVFTKELWPLDSNEIDAYNPRQYTFSIDDHTVDYEKIVDIEFSSWREFIRYWCTGIDMAYRSAQCVWSYPMMYPADICVMCIS